MLTNKDLNQLQQKGISEEKVKEQLNAFATGFPYLHIISPSTPGQGIMQPEHEGLCDYLGKWDNYLQGSATILKFVPASGAASRMFKDLFEFLAGESPEPTKPAEIQFFEEIENFAFYSLLNTSCIQATGKNIADQSFSYQ